MSFVNHYYFLFVCARLKRKTKDNMRAQTHSIAAAQKKETRILAAANSLHFQYSRKVLFLIINARNIKEIWKWREKEEFQRGNNRSKIGRMKKDMPRLYFGSCFPFRSWIIKRITKKNKEKWSKTASKLLTAGRNFFLFLLFYWPAEEEIIRRRRDCWRQLCAAKKEIH